MRSRAQPPDDIAPEVFFVRWVPERVADDADRRTKLAGTEAEIVFILTDRVDSFTVSITDGEVRGRPGANPEPDLRVELDEATWRALNRGELSAPEAVLLRRLKIHGDFVLALKLHLILG